MIIAVPTGIKIFNWLGRCMGENPSRDPDAFCIGFLFQFLIAGLTGCCFRSRHLIGN